MLAGPQPFSLRPDGPPGPGFRAGTLLAVQVLERLGAGRWLVGIRGRTLAVSAEVPLQVGATLLARVFRSDGRILLRVAPESGGLPAAPASLPDRVVAAFLAAGLNPRPESVQKVQRLLERLPPQGRQGARLAAMLLSRGVDLDSPGAAALLASLGSGQGGGGRQGRPWPRRQDQLEEELRRDLQRAGAGEGSELALFNHLQPEGEQWFFIPYRYGDCRGTIRLRRLPAAQEADRLVLATDGPWSFVLDRRPGGLRLRALRAGAAPGPRARRLWRRLAQKLQNLGVETDDTILGDEGFDGFSLPGEAGPYQRVDTEG